ncbi:MAG: proline-specific peptidase family protein [Limosilactobacillus oris]|jgi:proline iminopeptidase|uniref:proline-specific peptidase family protein n=1 Tax=Limosilactobacillus oris TaxID=1632 RepID=UPI00174D6547|nr:proline-specific peptidase family protein [Limosilactobacillus oris]MCH3910885.1 proline-specific peptidase family protein [Limosilactobacillus oris]MCH3938137.1 proline-specific peptidase family protein [Limosilactobacillus oris]MCI1981205.1 proline-specific peptidase family protein [Limosilactobacillus oris]UXC66630.1 proline-specific peptidase family protein [Limosilactobacillus oris]HJF46808.1 proline-specific peptidase family protein [Limosilactobacillus oris]
MKTGTKIITLDNGYHLWTNTQGEGDIHLLALHGGPGGNHEYWEDTAEQLAKQGLNVQVTMYDQLGSLYSDQPDYSDPEIAKKYLTYEYFLDEVDEVRAKLGLDNIYLIGQSWGGLLVQEYAVKYGQHLKGAIISSMVDEIDEYVDHVNALREKTLPADAVAFMKDCEDRNDYSNPKYQEYVQVMNEQYVDRKQPSKLYHLKDLGGDAVYNVFQGDNEFVVTGKLKDWHFRDQLKNIKVPTLLTFGEHETMPLETAKTMDSLIPNSKLVTTPNGGHHHMVDNPDVYYKHLADFIRSVEDGTFNK